MDEDKVKRMRYFEHEILDSADFEAEQEYNRDMRYRHNRTLHTWGVGSGLLVEMAEGQEAGTGIKAAVGAGVAINGEGKEIVVKQPIDIDFSLEKYTGGNSYYVTIAWHEQEAEPRQEDEPRELKRWEEVPQVVASGALPADQEKDLVLARVKLRNDKTIESIDNTLRKFALMKIGDKAVTEAKLDDSVKAKLVTEGDNHTHTAVDVGAFPNTGALNVTDLGNVGIRTEVPDSTLSVVAENAVDYPLDGNQIAGAFYGNPGANGRPVVVVSRGQPGSWINHGPFISFLAHGVDVGRISVNDQGTIAYLPFTGSHLAWCEHELKPNTLVSMTCINKTSIEDKPASEPIYGVSVTSVKNDKAVLGVVFSTEEDQVLVAAVGNHFIRVMDNGKDIEVGDALISSNVAGHAEKDPQEDKYSHVIGRASEPVIWADVDDYAEDEAGNKVKHKLISLLFGFYEKRNN